MSDELQYLREQLEKSSELISAMQTEIIFQEQKIEALEKKVEDLELKIMVISEIDE